MSTIHIITLSNKPDYLQDAAASVAAQTRPCAYCVGVDDGRDWGGRYPPAVFFNESARAALPGDYLAWLSDDDLCLPEFAEALGGYLDEHPDVMCVYGDAAHIAYDRDTGESTPLRYLPRSHPVFCAGILPAGELDIGQVMIRRSALDALPYPYWHEEDTYYTRLSDGLLLNTLAVKFGLHPVKRLVKTLRTTPRSMHTALVGGQLVKVDWRRAV